MKKKILFTLLVFTMCVLTGCGKKEDTGLKVGPTVTPRPENATGSDADYDFEYSEDEVNRVLEGVAANIRLKGTEYDFEITDEMVCEMSDHTDGSSEVYVYDKGENMLAVLMYDKEKHLTQAFVNTFENSKQISGCEYKDGSLVKYYETAEGTGSFHVNAEYVSEGKWKLSYTGSKGLVYKEVSL